MPDGVRLAARLWRPVSEAPVPAILEYIPYRKTDMVRARDERNHPFFAAHGYACIRVDMRGSGDSEGHMPDMYDPAELDDARRVIDWLAAQAWCDGAVGMFGTSWGGTASLQASVNAPSALKAVIAVCATHDRFEDDIHYMGGGVLSDTFEWGATLPTILASPPTPNVGDDWLERWRARIDALAFPLENWLRESARGQYWRHGSVKHQTDDLSVPILAVGGWSDRYSNSVMSLVDARPDLVWGVVGPWGHHYPDSGTPGPAIDFQQMALAWWDHWLRPGPTKPIDWPRMRTWLREFDTPSDTLSQRAGRWIETREPASEAVVQSHDLGKLASASAIAPWTIPSDATVGVMSGDTGYFGRIGGLPLDQAADDAGSLVFETPVLEEDMVIYGAAQLHLSGTTSTGSGHIIARLNNVSPDEQVARIAYAVRNLGLNETLDCPDTPAKPGPFQARLTLHTTAYTARKGHRLRLSLSQSLWPLVVPPGAFSQIMIHAGTLALPLLSNAPQPCRTPPPQVQNDPTQACDPSPDDTSLTRWYSAAEDMTEVGWHQPLTTTYFPQTDTTFSFETRACHRLPCDQSNLSTTEISHQLRYARHEGDGVVATTLTAKHREGGWHIKATLKATWSGEEVGFRQWELEIPEQE